MNTFVSLLRGINVGGHKRLSMKDLAGLYSSLGFQSVQTYLQSGNVVFEAPYSKGGEIASRVEKALNKKLGLNVTVLVRDPDDLRRTVKQNPFAAKDPSKLHVTFLSARPSQIPTNKIDEKADENEQYSVSGREVYLFLPNGYGRSKLSNSFFERVLKVSATTRNWRTVTALLEMTEKPQLS